MKRNLCSLREKISHSRSRAPACARRLRAGHLATMNKLRQRKMKRSLFSITLLAALTFHGQFAQADCNTTNGCGNTASGISSTVGGGTNNNAVADFSTVGGG